MIKKIDGHEKKTIKYFFLNHTSLYKKSLVIL